MSDKADEEALQALLGTSLRTLFQQTINYSVSLSIQGVLGLRIDETKLLLLKVDEKMILSEVQAATSEPIPEQSREQLPESTPATVEAAAKNTTEAEPNDSNLQEMDSFGGDDDDSNEGHEPLPSVPQTSEQPVSAPGQATETMTVTIDGKKHEFSYMIEQVVDKQDTFKMQSFKTDGFTVEGKQNKYWHSFRCKECPFVTLKPFAMKQHLVVKHGRIGNICIRCGKAFPNPLSLQQHRKLHHPKPKDGGLVCHTCNKTFSSRLSCRTHIASQHEGLCYSCPYCFALFKYKPAALRHMKNCKVKSPDAENQKAVKVIQQEVLDESSGVVYKVLTDPADLPKEAEAPVGDSASQVEDTVGKNSGYEAEKGEFGDDCMEEGSESGDEDEDCEEETENNAAVATTSSHTRCRQRYTCWLCHKVFRSKPFLDEHIRNKHEKTLPYKCSVCNETFKFRAGFNRHKRRTCPDAEEPVEDESKSEYFREPLFYSSSRKVQKKTGPKLVCHICNKKFPRKDSLRDHIQGFHSQVDQYECAVCGEMFRYRGTLAKHRRAQHSGQKSVRPNNPSMKIVVPKVTKKKKRRRKPNQMKVVRKEVKEHLEEATSYVNEEPVFVYRCTLCDKRLTRKGSLQDHMKAEHMGIRLSCSQCGETFKYRTFLAKHRRKTGCAKPESRRSKAGEGKKKQQSSKEKPASGLTPQGQTLQANLNPGQQTTAQTVATPTPVQQIEAPVAAAALSNVAIGPGEQIIIPQNAMTDNVVLFSDNAEGLGATRETLTNGTHIYILQTSDQNEQEILVQQTEVADVN